MNPEARYEMPLPVAKGCVTHVDTLIEKADKIDDFDEDTHIALIEMRNSIAFMCNSGLDPVIVPYRHREIFEAVIRAAMGESQPLVEVLLKAMEIIIKRLEDDE